MFNCTGKKNYKVLFINGGTGANGRAYTFITIEDMPQGGAKYGEKLKINLWGEDLSQTIRANDYIKILGVEECGMVSRKDKNTDKWYENNTIVCGVGDIVLGEKPVKKDKPAEPQVMQPIDDGELPF